MNGGARRGHIFQLNVSNGGVPKMAVSAATVSAAGLVGDAHNDTRNHGAPDAALCLYSLEGYLRLQAEGHPAFPGSLGENIVTAGLDFASLRPGDRLRLGRDVEIKLTRYTTPCLKIARSFNNGRFERILATKHPGDSRLYARVTQGGTLAPGDPVEVLEQSSLSVTGTRGAGE